MANGKCRCTPEGGRVRWIPDHVEIERSRLVEAGGIEPPSETRLAQVSTSVAPTTFLASRPRRSWVRPANHLNVPPTPAALAGSEPAWFMPLPSPAGAGGATGA